MAEDNKKYVELLWYQKYDKISLGKKMPIERPNLPFQVVETVNKPRIKEGEQQFLYPEDEWPKNYPKDWKNLLIWGDNKLVMSSLIKQGWAGKINLIYIDPPFFTGADFTVRTKIGDKEIEKEPSIIEERAYKDTWSGGIASYLKYMYERLVLMRELLAENGSIYVHLDWHVGHYVKVMMDEIFGYENFVNEIVWCYTRPAAPNQQNFSRVHDILLWFTKGQNYVFNPNRVRIPYAKSSVARAGYAGKASKMTAGEPVKLKEGGKIPEDWWNIPMLKGNSEEFLSFGTQKPEALLKRIILASSMKATSLQTFSVVLALH
jgi:Adenine specific DNA methylase Mod